VAKVTGFLGQNNKPMPLRQSEVDRILNQVHEGAERPKPSITFEIGEQVRVARTGPSRLVNGVARKWIERPLAASRLPSRSSAARRR